MSKRRHEKVRNLQKIADLCHDPKDLSVERIAGQLAFDCAMAISQAYWVNDQNMSQPSAFDPALQGIEKFTNFVYSKGFGSFVPDGYTTDEWNGLIEQAKEDAMSEYLCIRVFQRHAGKTECAPSMCL